MLKSDASDRLTPSDHYTQLRALLREAATLGSVAGLLNWDQETYMPPSAAEHRAAQMAMVAGLVHERRTSPRIGELIAACESSGVAKSDPDGAEAANLRCIRRDYDRATRLPTKLVTELAHTASLSQEAWKNAREKSDFSIFLPWLDKMVGLTRRKAECFGVPAGGELYDALLEEYEPGATAKEIDAIFKPLALRLSTLVQELTAKGKRPDDRFLNVSFAPAGQHEMGQFVLKHMGFDFNAGRLDTTTHPFCSGMAPGDTRLTTRYRGERFADALYGTMHEGGHGLYEQGLPKTGSSSRWGEPLADSTSLGIHESQSRMWENFVGRSREFWQWLLPHARKFSSGALDGFSPEQAYLAANIVTPSHIRVEADEATYNMHVMLRFELERAIFGGGLKIADLPGEWNSRFKRLLGVDVPDHRRGCLQDVHWSFGLIGYFPTYTLGNLYAAQFWETIRSDIPDLDPKMARGEFADLKSWLNDRIHRHGRRFQAGELCQRVTGRPLSSDPLMRHLEGKFKAVYGI